jgi:hypothetical protein
MKKSIITTIILFAMVACYIRGYRIITLEEIPNSHRPAQIFLSADYGATHFQGYSQNEADYVTELSKGGEK